MVVARGVPLQDAARVQEEGRIFVFVMAGERGVNLGGVARVHRVALISVRLMVAGRDVGGASQGHSMATKLMAHVILLLGEKLAFVQCMER